MASIKDVAKLAKVGPATVSRVLNGTGYVAEETRVKVEAAIKELNYKPNELARNLFRSRAGIIAVLVPDTLHPFFGTFVTCVEHELFQYGYKTMLCNTTEQNNAENEYLEMLERHIVDGIITDVHTLDVEEYKQIDKPIIAFDRYLGKSIPLISADHKLGGRLAAEELLRNGCKNVLHITEAEIFEAPFHERHKEFERIMLEHDVTVQRLEIGWNEFGEGYYHELVGELFEKGFHYDGVFGGDMPVIACMNECLNRGYRIPEDVKLIAYDGTYVTDLAMPKLTTVVQPIAELAKETVRTLIDKIDGKEDIPVHVMLPVELRQGSTTIQK